MGRMPMKSALFFDTVVNKIDNKGRVSVPADYRAVLDSQNAELVAFPSFKLPCIECCSTVMMDRLAGDIDRSFDMFSQQQDDMASMIYASAKIFAFDSTGRIVLSEKLMRFAGITDKAAFVGKGRTFQIWNPDTFAKEEEQIRARVLKAGLALKAGDGK